MPSSRPRRRSPGIGRYEKRPVTTVGPRPQPGSGMTSAEARALAAEIEQEQERWRIGAIRLVGTGVCCVVLVDRQGSGEHEIHSREDWERLRESGPEAAE
jgi:hypothetical protein